MIHDYPDRLTAFSLEDEMPTLEPQRGGNGLGKVVLTLIALSVAIAVLVTQIDWQEAYDRLFPADVVTEPIRTKEQIALIEATQADQTKVAAEGEEAESLNDAIPFAKGPVETALPFYITDTSMTNSEKALRCMTQAVYYEAGFEPVTGRYAVAIREAAAPAASSALPATARCSARQAPRLGQRRVWLRKKCFRAQSHRRSAWPRIITPIMSRLIGHPSFTKSPIWARISSTAGPATGDGVWRSAESIAAVSIFRLCPALLI
jgi:hypothetical protein